MLANWDGLKGYIEEVRSRIDADFVVDLRDELWQVVERYGEAKTRAGQLDFLDLLLSSKRLLDNEDARSYFQARYPYIFIDEFQDTDPVQAEVLRRIWKHPVIAGDRKQSIYRFRRADVPAIPANLRTDVGIRREHGATCQLRAIHDTDPGFRERIVRGHA